jgi:hypothetical protein
LHFVARAADEATGEEGLGGGLQDVTELLARDFVVGALHRHRANQHALPRAIGEVKRGFSRAAEIDPHARQQGFIALALRRDHGAHVEGIGAHRGERHVQATQELDEYFLELAALAFGTDHHRGDVALRRRAVGRRGDEHHHQCKDQLETKHLN